MNNEQLPKVKQLYNSICELINNPSIHLVLLKTFPTIKDLPPDKLFWLESLEFMAYISTADGKISQKEVNIMNYITGNYMTLESVQKLIKDKRFLEQMNEVPMTVRFLCGVENFLYQNNLPPTTNDSIMNTLITYFKAVAFLIANEDNNISTNEAIRIRKYINMIKEYATNNTLSPFFEY